MSRGIVLKGSCYACSQQTIWSNHGIDVCRPNTRPGLFQFLKKLKEEQRHVESECAREDFGLPQPRRKRKVIALHRQINERVLTWNDDWVQRIPQRNERAIMRYLRKLAYNFELHK